MSLKDFTEMVCVHRLCVAELLEPLILAVEFQVAWAKPGSLGTRRGRGSARGSLVSGFFRKVWVEGGFLGRGASSVVPMDV